MEAEYKCIVALVGIDRSPEAGGPTGNTPGTAAMNAGADTGVYEGCVSWDIDRRTAGLGNTQAGSDKDL